MSDQQNMLCSFFNGGRPISFDRGYLRTPTDDMIDHTEEKLYIGIDAGGTKTDVSWRVADTSGRFDERGLNATRDGIEIVADALAEYVVRAIADAPDSGAVEVCAGVAGAGSPEIRNLLRAALETKLRAQLRAGVGCSATVVSDAELALFAAHGTDPGLVVVVGTGSIALMRTRDGRIVVRGGLGYLLGDEGSGYALGHAAARYAAHSIDRGEVSPLARALLTELGATGRESLLRVVYGDQYPLQRLAPILLRLAAAGDRDAIVLVSREADALKPVLEAIEAACDQPEEALSVCLFGGLASHRYYRNVIKQSLPATWSVVEPREKELSRAAIELIRAEPKYHSGD